MTKRKKQNAQTVAVNLRLDWCSYEAASYACKNWHYSKSMPSGKRAMVGVWEDGRFIGVIIFSSGANNNIWKPFDLSMQEVCELTRVALTKHKSEVTRIVSIAMKMFKKQSQNIKLIVSYADPEQGHSGGIYKGGNWDYLGKTVSQKECMLNGKTVHRKTIHTKYRSIVGLPKSKSTWKHKFVYWFDKSAREVFMLKRSLSSERGGKIPTHALH